MLFNQEFTMHTFQVADMTCGHCVSAITKAVQAVDANARVEVDLAQHAVRIDGARVDADALAAAITDAGYHPVKMEAPAFAGAAPRRSSCCGSCC
ncbi:heavy-metal-associated domain-containing protein [Roseateles puraquae]